MADVEELEFLKSSRTRLRTKCSKRCNTVASDIDAHTDVEINSFISEFQDIMEKLDSRYRYSSVTS